MNGVTIIRAQGGLGRILPDGDHISALIIYGEQDLSPLEARGVDSLEKDGVTADTHPVLHYHASEFFRMNPGAKLYLQGVAASDGAFTEVKTLQTFAKGEVRQVAVCDFKTAIKNGTDDVLAARVGTLNAIAKELSSGNQPLSVLYSAKIVPEDMASLPNIHNYHAERVSVVIAQDGAGRGNYLAATHPSISCIGAVLGCVSRAGVHESIGWVARQNLVSAGYGQALTGGAAVSRELETLAFCDGSKQKDYTPGQLQSLFEKGYIFGATYPGIAGSYLCDSFTATALDSDFAYIEAGRTLDKAARLVYIALGPQIAAPVYIDPDSGRLAETTAKALEVLCEDALDPMLRDGQLSGFSVFIDPDQSVLRTSKLQVTIQIVPVGSMRQIEVTLGLTLKL